MKHFYYFVLVLIMVLSPLSFLYAQVPNAGFENWTGTEPDHWLTNNSPSINLFPILQSAVSHSGSYSLRAEVKTFGFPVAPLALAGDNGNGFPVSQKFANFSGYYQFSQVASNDAIVMQLAMFSNGSGIGGADFLLGMNTANWTQFSAPIIYFVPGIPDSCVLSIQILDTLAGIPDVGTYALIDDLTLSGTVSIPDDNSPIVHDFILRQNYPNPFNPETNIEFYVPHQSQGSLIIYNQLGQEIDRLVNGEIKAGWNSIKWVPSNLIPSGIFYYQIKTTNFIDTKKMILIR